MNTAKWNVDERRRAPARALYFIRAMAADWQPWSWHARRLDRALAAVRPEKVSAALAERVAYLNRMPPVTGTPKHRLADIPRHKITYAIDFLDVARGFGPEMRADLAFGDVTKVPAVPAFVKSRPIGAGSENAVLLKLNQFRHYHFPRDPLAFADKKPTAVWRGRVANNPLRRALAKRHGAAGHLDIGGSLGRDGDAEKPFLSIADQLRYRYVISVEGIDVATNLKWIFASNSVCLMPRPRFETWFMEGRLLPWVHYAPLRDDFSDLDDVIQRLNEDPPAAERIIANAKAWTHQFRDPRREHLVALLVLAKYFERTGQRAPGSYSFVYGDPSLAKDRVLLDGGEELRHTGSCNTET
ncbi:MAG: glycosyl transferase family 90 [Pseudomonadota bacterium]